MYDYLDLLERRLDDRQKRVCCRTENTVVAAGAGSGKTQVLATRFAWLVMSRGIPAKDILTLTFTKKAAGEMYERIYRTLAFFARSGATPDAERERARAALDSFGEARIQTFDSYCAGIVRQAANRYGIRPDFTADSAGTGSALRAAALPFVLTHREHPAVRAFADAGRLQEFAEDVLAGTVGRYATLADGDTFFSERLGPQLRRAEADLRWFTEDTGARPEGLDGAMSLGEVQDLLAEALDAAEPGPYADTCRLIAGRIARVRDGSGAAALPQGNGAAAEPRTARPPLAADTPGLSEISAGTDEILALIGRLPGKGYTKGLRSAVKSLRENTLPYLSALCAYLRRRDDIGALLSLLDRFHAQVRRDKRVSGSLSFRDIQKMALRALREHDDLRAQEHAAYQAVMIDEFQDNNGENRDLLFLICSPPEAGSRPTVRDIERERLFFVGDEKQSIYQFRGADVSVFNALQRDFREAFGDGSVLPMEYNYRSSPALVAGFNRLFGGTDGIFIPAGTPAPDYEARYAADTKKYNAASARALPAETLDAGNVALHVCLFNRAHLRQNEAMGADDRIDLPDEKEQTAHFIARTIRGLHESGARFGDIAILDRSRADRGVLLRHLNALGIPYRVDQHKDLFASGVVFDLHNFLRLCVYPGDRTALAAYLASPLAALSENAVETVLAGGGTDGLSPDDGRRLDEAMRFLDGLRERVLSQPLTRTLQALWYETGYRYETFLSTHAALCAEQFDLLYELARQCDAAGRGAAWFVDQLALLKDGAASSFGTDDAELDAGNVSPPAEREDAVQVLTIHKSKGLQYKHVFVCGCTGVHSKNESHAVSFDETYGVTVRPEKGCDNYFALLRREDSRRKEAAEFRRLLYVAITRAEQDVRVVGAVSPPARNSTDDGGDGLRLIERQLDRYYPQWKDDLGYALGNAAYADGAPFDFLSLMPVDRAVMLACRTAEPAPRAARTALIEAFSEPYARAMPVTAERERALRTTPRALEADDAPLVAAPLPDPYAAVNAIIDSYAGTAADGQDDGRDGEDAQQTGRDGALQCARFSYADFGTLAHAYLEAAAKGTAPQSFTPESRLLKHLTEREAEVMREACAAMAAGFSRSGLGAAMQDARANGRPVKSEHAFRTLVADRALTGTDDGLLVTGVIDLLFGNADGTYTIVDYKSDRLIRPGLYEAQQECYRLAAARLLSCPERNVRCYLYYLRYGMTVEVGGAR